MTPERWAEIDRAWHAVLSRPEAEREAAVVELCGSDKELRAEVEALLANLAQASAAGFGAIPGVAPGSGSLVGTTLGQYSVHALLGIGGMGEVYQAHDSTLGRDVALKILPDLWHRDADRLARFDREARVLASLNHPNIGAIYGVHNSHDVKALVLELVEGETLADRIARQPSRRGLPIEDVTTLAAQIIDALEAAHERGIVHRDLKPGNIKIRPDGRVKVLDFGLARAVSGGSSPALANSPTITAATAGGVLLGTTAYMSPEQARGRSVDKRTDIWAFGCVLYELLTGTSAFGGGSVTEVLANVINGEPDWAVLPSGTPPAMRMCVERCLQRDPRQRFHDVGDVRLLMQGVFERYIVNSETERPSSVSYAGWATAAIVALAAGIGLFRSSNRPPVDLPETRFELVTPPTSDPASLAISPDGRSIVFASGAGQPLSLRRLDSNDARPLMGTAGGTMPFWSPDGRSIAFFAGGTLKRFDLDGDVVLTLASAPQPRRGAWSNDGTIIFGAGSVGPLLKVPAGGGNVQQATRLLPGQTNHRWPQFLPDGRRFFLMSLGASDVRGVYLGSLDSGDMRRISDREFAYAFMAPTHLLFARQGAMWAKRLTPDYGSVEGELIPVAPKVVVSRDSIGFGSLSASGTGSIAYRASPQQTQFVWLDRAGRLLTSVGQPNEDEIFFSALSADGRNAALSRVVDGNNDVWFIDTERGVFRRITSDSSGEGAAIFSTDGGRIIYTSDGKEDVDQIYERASDGSGGATLVFESAENKNPTDWSRDGRYVVFISQSADTNFDLWALRLFGDGKPFAVARTPFAELSARFSPDGRWVAYSSNESGSTEIYVQRFPNPGGKVQVSVGGGLHPRWRSDGRELFYLAPDRRVMVVAISEQAAARLESTTPRALFTLPTLSRYEPSADGQRFLTTTVVKEASPISVILNWKPPVQ
jgi:serine/threonine protein kinase